MASGKFTARNSAPPRWTHDSVLVSQRRALCHYYGVSWITLLVSEAPGSSAIICLRSAGQMRQICKLSYTAPSHSGKSSELGLIGHTGQSLGSSTQGGLAGRGSVAREHRRGPVQKLHHATSFRVPLTCQACRDKATSFRSAAAVLHFAMPRFTTLQCTTLCSTLFYSIIL